MPKGKDHGPSIKDDRLYEELREEGESKEKAARIANAAANEGRSAVGRRGGKSEPYEEWNVDELREKAAQVGIEGRSKMKKRELVSALRNH
jgi:Rho termination factor, N-terminal domain